MFKKEVDKESKKRHKVEKNIAEVISMVTGIPLKELNKMKVQD